MPALLFLLLFPTVAGGWTLDAACELVRETPDGKVAVARSANGLLFYPPEGLVANDTWIKIGIGGRSWRERVVGGAVELEGGVKPFLNKSWMTVHAQGERLLGLNLVGTSAAWGGLDGCRAPSRKGWLLLSGPINASTDDRIIRDIRRQRPEGLVLNSEGGLAEEAQRIGISVRENGLAAKVESRGQCLSECVFILAAGMPRAVAPDASVGMDPSLITEGLGVFDAGPGPVIDSAVYFSRMGVDGGGLAVLATSVPSGEIHLMAPAELRRVGLIDAKVPDTSGTPFFGQVSDLDENVWWLLLGLLGLGAGLWGLTRIWGDA